MIKKLIIRLVAIVTHTLLPPGSPPHKCGNCRGLLLNISLVSFGYHHQPNYQNKNNQNTHGHDQNLVFLHPTLRFHRNIPLIHPGKPLSLGVIHKPNLPARTGGRIHLRRVRGRGHLGGRRHLVRWLTIRGRIHLRRRGLMTRRGIHLGWVHLGRRGLTRGIHLGWVHLGRRGLTRGIHLGWVHLGRLGHGGVGLIRCIVTGQRSPHVIGINALNVHSLFQCPKKTFPPPTPFQRNTQKFPMPEHLGLSPEPA